MPCVTRPYDWLTDQLSFAEKEGRLSTHYYLPHSSSSTHCFLMTESFLEDRRLETNKSCSELEPFQTHQDFHSQCKVFPHCCRVCSQCHHHIICVCSTNHQPLTLAAPCLEESQKLDRSRSQRHSRPPPCSGPRLCASNWVVSETLQLLVSTILDESSFSRQSSISQYRQGNFSVEVNIFDFVVINHFFSIGLSTSS